jgi:hypothetical protein
MFDAHQKSTGTGYTTTVAFLVVAFIFISAILLLSRPVGYAFISSAIVCSAICIVFALVIWNRSPRLSIPTIETQKVTAK